MVQNNNYANVDEVEDYLRRANPAYKRRPQAQFRKVVERAVQTVQREGGPIKPELRLQVNTPSRVATLVLSVAVTSSHNESSTRCRGNEHATAHSCACWLGNELTRIYIGVVP
jgi:hypothetical protein